MISEDNLPSIGGEAFFITDGNPVNNLQFFLQPLHTAICSNAKIPEAQIPFTLLIILGILFNFLSRIFGTKFALPIWALTLTEAYKVNIFRLTLKPLIKC